MKLPLRRIIYLHMNKFISIVFALAVAAVPMHTCAENWSDWHYHVDASVHPQADDSYDAVYADFTHLLKSNFHSTGTLDENSIRVVLLKAGQPSTPVAYRFVKDTAYQATDNAAGTLIFAVAASKEPATVDYRVYFDTKANGTKPAFQNSDDVPEVANMIWNNSFEILSKDYKGPNRYGFAGENMPQGWWGNLRNSGILANQATSAHSGQHAFSIVTPADKSHISFSTTPSPPALRLVPGRSYAFSFWAKGEQLSSSNPLTASIYWYDQDEKFTTRSSINTELSHTNDFDWTETELYITAPDDAYFGTMYLGTYSKTGLLTVDDISIRLAVPPLLQ